MWADAMQQRDHDEQFDRFGTMLGTNWNRKQVAAMFSQQKGSAPRDSVVIPLAFTLQPELQTALKELFGATGTTQKPQWADEVVEASTLPRDQFLALAGVSSVGLAVQQLRARRGDAPY
jgi:hypothetical protein